MDEHLDMLVLRVGPLPALIWVDKKQTLIILFVRILSGYSLLMITIFQSKLYLNMPPVEVAAKAKK